jgi:hypothetical protein
MLFQTLLLDFKGGSISMVAQFTPALAKKVTTCTEKIFPLRQKGNHMINTPMGFETGYKIFKTVLSEKNKSRVSGLLIVNDEQRSRLILI